MINNEELTFASRYEFDGVLGPITGEINYHGRRFYFTEDAIYEDVSRGVGNMTVSRHKFSAIRKLIYTLLK